MGYATYVCFDLETTGLNPSRDEILEIGAVQLDAQGTIVDRFEQLACPSIPIPAEASRIHGIDAATVLGAPPPSHIIKNFVDWIPSSSLLIAHNAPYDAAFLLAALSGRIGRETGCLPVLDTLAWSRSQLPQLGNHKLVTLANHLKLDTQSSHRGLSDAVTVQQLFCHLHRLSVSPTDAIEKFSLPLKSSAKQYTFSSGPKANRMLRGEATERQLDFLTDLGASERQIAGLSKKDASELIDKLIRRRDRGKKREGTFGILKLVMIVSIVSVAFTTLVMTSPGVEEDIRDRSEISAPITRSAPSSYPPLPNSVPVEAQISEGLSIEEVVTILGVDFKPILTLESPGRPTLRTMEWSLPAGGSIRVTFENDWVTRWEKR